MGIKLVLIVWRGCSPSKLNDNDIADKHPVNVTRYRVQPPGSSTQGSEPPFCSTSSACASLSGYMCVRAASSSPSLVQISTTTTKACWLDGLIIYEEGWIASCCFSSRPRHLEPTLGAAILKFLLTQYWCVVYTKMMWIIIHECYYLYHLSFIITNKQIKQPAGG